MSRPSVTVEVVTAHTAWVHTSVGSRPLFVWLEKLGIPRQYNHAEQLWMIPRSRVADLVADCERSRRPVHVLGAWA